VLFLNQHKNLVSEVASKNGGSIINGEGDSFWLVFPSVTAAAIAAVELQQELRSMQAGISDGERIAVRVVIALGDVLHQENDIFGDTVNLTARVESITPPDEIYLSQAAWLALNKAEVQSSFVNEFTLKGISDAVNVYKIEQKHRTREIKDQVIVVTDVGGFTTYYLSHPIGDSESLLIFLDDQIKRACEKNGGVVRVILADGHILTFSDGQNALRAVTEICERWNELITKHEIPCGYRVGVHKGDVYIFRSHLYGDAINKAVALAGMKRFSRLGCISVLVSQEFVDDLPACEWKSKLEFLQERIYSLTMSFTQP
jgi:class 3 adenylate cyclase